MVWPILEREREFADLAAAAREAKDGAGSVVLITGEAGIGKSSLVNSLRAVLPAEGRLLIGYCDDLATPRVLGPLRDLAASVGTGLATALESGDRGRVIDALRAELEWPEHPTVLVVEDAHWADEATLDVLRFLFRRLASMPVVLVLTYRDAELTRDHPLQQLLGLTSTVSHLRRLPLARLSVDAVRRLGDGTGLDTDEVYAVTSGNPFFVTEVVASGDLTRVPPTVTEAVRARFGGLDTATRDALEHLAVVPSAVERWLVEAVVSGGLAALAAAEQRGMLTVTPHRVMFRHELTRRAVIDSMPAARRVACNRAVLSALRDRGGDVDVSRLLHHAAEVGDADVVIRYGPAAARGASAAGSHREAVAHYRLVLDHQAAYPPGERAELLEGYAVECYTIGLTELAIPAQRDAVALRRALGDRVALGRALRWLSRVYWWSGARPEAEAAGAEAIEVLEAAGDRHTLALALSNQAQLLTLAGRHAESITLGERVVAMARETTDAGLLSHALTNVGMARWLGDSARGRALIEEGLAIALEAGEIEQASRAYVNLIWNLIDDLAYADADRLLTVAVEMAEQAEFFGFLSYMRVERAMVDFARGAWDDAERAASTAVDAPLSVRCPALAVLGRIRIRRGQAGGAELLAQAWDIAVRLGEAQRTGPVAAGLAEAAWLRGDLDTLRSTGVPAYDEIRRFGERSRAAELAYWLHLAGVHVPVDDPDHLFALQIAGRWREAADGWQRVGCPYEHAAALAESHDPGDVLRALGMLDTLGAEPLARRVRARLRSLGVAHVPRGPAPSTRDNPAGLTGRQAQIAGLLIEGLSNVEIAARLVLSVRTVDSHVAAVLGKLGARTRRDVAARARELGLTRT